MEFWGNTVVHNVYSRRIDTRLTKLAKTIRSFRRKKAYTNAWKLQDEMSLKVPRPR